MRLTNEQRDLILRGLFELTITHVEDDQLRADVVQLAEELGGNPDVMFFGVTQKREA